jgi:MoaA/NifB/PqqE/SkfB family radical SAM enzyme
MNKKLQELFNLKRFPYRINWEITQQCNFDCEYCSNCFTVNKTPLPNTYQPIELKNIFDQTGISWLILITGGEPFLYPDFVGICNELTQKHHLQITTNLSLKEVYDFADTINPDKVFNISASYHRMTRNSVKAKKEFIDKCHYLIDRKFKIIVNLIAYPPIIDTIESDVFMFKNEGIDTMLFGYRGIYNSKQFPAAYSESELDLIRKYAIDETEIKIATNDLNYYGYYCEAGSKYFSLSQNGDIGRCFTLPKKIGNLFEGKFKPDTLLKPCISKQCNDCYNGPASITNKKANWAKVILEKKRYQKPLDL